MLKAIWMSATTQPCALFIGPTNSVQPYCRLAIITMQMMTTISCHQRLGATAPMLLSDISIPSVVRALIPPDRYSIVPSA